MPLTEYRITLLITRADGEDETRVVHQEAWSANDAIETAKQRARQDDDVKDVQCQNVS